MLPFWIEFFEDLQNIRGRSQNTVLAYRRDLELYETFLESGKKLEHFYEFMRTHQLSPRSQARVVSSLRTYFKYCEKKGQKSPELLDLKSPPIKVKLPRIISFDEFKQLFQQAKVDSPHKTSRNELTLLMLYGVGCRVSELIHLDLADYQESEMTLKILGKGNKERLVPLTQEVNEKLVTYLKLHREHLLKNEKVDSIIINEKGRRPSRVDIWRWLAAWSHQAGFADPVGPHQFRHACATSLLENGADLRAIQMLLGHASLQTTQIYTTVTHKNLVRTIDDHHPLAKLEK